MLYSSLSLWPGITFVLVGAVNVCLIVQVLGRVRDTRACSRLIVVHRLGGYLFIVVVEFARSCKTCTVRSGQTLSEAAEEHAIGIPSSCRQGQCGTCKTKLLAGNVRMNAEEGLDPDSRAHGFVLTCVGHANGAVSLMPENP